MAPYCGSCGLAAHRDGAACARPWGDGERFCAHDGRWLGTHRPEASLRPVAPEMATAPVVVRVRVGRPRPSCPRCGGSLVAGADELGRRVAACIACGEEVGLVVRVA